MTKRIEVEGGELMLESAEGHYAIIPAKDRAKVQKMVEDNCEGCINSYIQKLPKEANYAEDGTLIHQMYEEKTGKPWSSAREEGLTDGSYEGNMALRTRLLSDNTTTSSNYLTVLEKQ